MSFDKIRALDDREKSREKLPIFYGSRSNKNHGFREVAINNTIDEISNNYDNGIIDIILHDDCKTITVRDTGRGMPIAGVSNGVSNWELFFTILFASGKYDITEGENSGTNGVGGTILNYSSVIYNVRSFHNGEEYIIEFENGGYIKTPLTYIGETKEHGTEITFKLDKECYTNVVYTDEELIDIVNKVSSVSPKTTINFTHKGITKSYHYNTIEDYYKQNIPSDYYFVCGSKSYDDNNEVTKIECVLSPSNEPIQQSFLNRNHLLEGGSINEGFIDGVKTFINKYAKEMGLYGKNEKTISNNDVESSISFVISVLSSNVEFQSQTKFATQKKLYKQLAKRYIQEYLEIFKIERQAEFKLLVNTILITKRANEKADTIRKDVRKKLEEKVTNSSNRPEKFVPCRSKDPREVELILIEGESAKNSVVTSRDRNTMCVYPLKGKPMNVMKKDIDTIMKNVEIQDIYKILGCGISYNGKNVKGLPHFNIDNLNVDKVVILTDRDDDGRHIESLLIGIFYTLSKELIEQGKIYVVHAPLYIIKTKKEDIFAYSESEKNEIVKELNLKNVKFTETRYKGLGGLAVQAMNKTAMSKENRKITQLTWEDAEKCKDMLELCLTNEKATERKEFIEKEGSKYFDFSILEG